ncbi:hypothetical protein ACLOJK_038246 [Asimina triloba]
MDERTISIKMVIKSAIFHPTDTNPNLTPTEFGENKMDPFKVDVESKQGSTLWSTGTIHPHSLPTFTSARSEKEACPHPRDCDCQNSASHLSRILLHMIYGQDGFVMEWSHEFYTYGSLDTSSNSLSLACAVEEDIKIADSLNFLLILNTTRTIFLDRISSRNYKDSRFDAPRRWPPPRGTLAMSHPALLDRTTVETSIADDVRLLKKV